MQLRGDKMFKMAFRNLSRNRRRSFLTISAILIGISFSCLLLGWINGVGNMVTEQGKRITGDIRISATDFEIKGKALDVSSNISLSEVKKIMKDKIIQGRGVGRIKFGSLMFVGDEDEKALGFGIEPEDYNIVGFKDFMTSGRFLDFKNKGEIIVGAKLKEKLNLKLGDEVTVLSATQHRSSYALTYKIVGFYAMDNEALNRTFYITMEDAMYHLDMEDRVTEFLVFLDKPETLNKNFNLLKSNKELLVKPWNEIGLNSLLSGVLPIIKTIFTFAFAILAGVGITNTMMMIVYERRKEIGVMKAQGFRNNKILKMFILEGGIMGVIGSGLGALVGGLLTYYFSVKGINLGGVTKNLGDSLNIKSIVYMVISFKIVMAPLMAGVITSILATIIAVSPELRAEAVKNLRGE